MGQGFSFGAWLSSFQIRWLTWRRGERVGVDSFGNRYYRDRKHPLHGRERRWVLYKGAAEASAVPPEWHGWLHHVMDAPLSPDSPYHQPWVTLHQPNLTGTAAAWYPPGHVLSGVRRARATGDYDAWTPEV